MTFKEQVLQIIKEHEKEYNPVDDYVTTDELAWLYEEIRSLNDNPWHIDIPTEEGWYLCKTKISDFSVHHYDGNAWDFCPLDFVIKWQKIEEDS